MGHAFALALAVTLGLGFFKVTDRLELGWGWVLAPVILWAAGSVLRVGTSWLLVGLGSLALKRYSGRLEAVYGRMTDALSALNDDELETLLANVTEELVHRNGVVLGETR